MKAAGSSLLCCTGTRAHRCHICTGTGAHPTHVHRTTSNFKIHRTCTSTWGAGAYAGQCASVETSPGCKSNSIFIPIPVRDGATAVMCGSCRRGACCISCTCLQVRGLRRRSALDSRPFVASWLTADGRYVCCAALQHNCIHWHVGFS